MVCVCVKSLIQYVLEIDEVILMVKGSMGTDGSATHWQPLSDQIAIHIVL